MQTWLIVLAVVLLLSIIGNIIYMIRSGRMSDENERLTTEVQTLQNENLVLSETIEVKDGVIEEHQEALEALTEEHENMIQEKDAQIYRLNRRVSASADDLEKQKELNGELNARIEELESMHQDVVAELNDLKEEKDALSNAYDELTARAAQAEEMKAYNIFVLTKWDRFICADRYNVSRARRVDHTFISFELDGTIFTPEGSKTVHVLLYNPEGDIMYPSSGTFTMTGTGDESQYTLSRQIEYAHQPVHLEFGLEHPERLPAGSYTLEVYVDGSMTRAKEFALE